MPSVSMSRYGTGLLNLLRRRNWNHEEELGTFG
jgi:hypothetical protein